MKVDFERGDKLCKLRGSIVLLDGRFLRDGNRKCKLRSFAHLARHRQFSSMRSYNIVTQTQSQPGSLACRLGREEWLKDLVFDTRGDAKAIVGDRDLHHVAQKH